MKRSIPALFLAAALILHLSSPALAAAGKRIEPAAEPWYAEAQRYVTEKGLMVGSENGFLPTAPATRATVFHTLWNLEGQPSHDGRPSFPDALDQWFEPSAAWAEQAGLATGDQNGLYHGEREVTRAELAVIFARYLLKVKGFAYPKGNSLSSYTDLGRLPAWALDGMAVCTSYRLITGDGEARLNPSATATRAELAVMMMNLTRLEQKTAETSEAIQATEAVPEDPDMDPGKAEDFLDGLMKTIYLGKYEQTYLDLTGITRAQAQRTHENALTAQVETFFYYYSVEYPTSALRDEVRGLYEDIYSHTSYEILSASRRSDGSFAVRLSIRPIDAIRRMNAVWESAMAPFLARYPLQVQQAMSESEYIAMDREWGRQVADLLAQQVPGTGNLPAKTLTVTLSRGENGRYSISDEDLRALDDAVLDYTYDPDDQKVQATDAQGNLLTLTRQTITFTRREESLRLKVSGLPEDAGSLIVWGSSDPRVAMVDDNGLVTAVAPGSCTISATVNGATLSCTVKCDFK